MNQYGNMVVATLDAGISASEVRKRLFRQAYQTWEELGAPPIISFKFMDSPGDFGCMATWYDDDGQPWQSHSIEPHHHYAWKMTLDN